MNRVGDDLLLQSLERQEDYIHTAADAIDVKAGLILAAGAVLAVQPAVLLIAPNIPALAFIAQSASFLLLLIAVGFSHAALKVTEYESPGFDEEWRDQQIAAALDGSTEEDVKKTILWGLVNQAKDRVAVGRVRNDSKLKLLNIARQFTTASFVLNLLIITAILITRSF